MRGDNRPRVLVCDDDEAVLEVTKAILEMKGYSVITMKTTENVVDKVEKTHPTMILMDLGIPPEGGEAATEKLKNDPHTSDIPIVIFSAASDLGVIAHHSFADDYLAKPFEIRDLENKVGKYCRPGQRPN